MIFNLYSTYDRVAGVYGEIFLAAKDALAIRRFNFVMKNAAMVSADCDLYCLGTYDSETGIIVGFDKPQFVSRYEVTDE